MQAEPRADRSAATAGCAAGAALTEHTELTVPNIGVFHPQVVHFVVALFVVGAIFRLIGLLGKPKFVNPMAATLLILATLASVVAVKSGEDAHGPVERLPGALAAMDEHEEWGERARNVFIVVAAFELLALAFTKRDKAARYMRAGSAIVAVAGLFVLYEAAEHGGELVYSYAGGVGTRSGEPEDVTRLLVAGLHHKAALERSAGNLEEAARLTAEMLRQRPDEPYVRLAMAQSHFRDRDDARAALDELARITVEESGSNLDLRKGMLTADAYLALDMQDSARSVLQALAQRFPDMARIRARLDSIRPM